MTRISGDFKQISKFLSDLNEEFTRKDDQYSRWKFTLHIEPKEDITRITGGEDVKYNNIKLDDKNYELIHSNKSKNKKDHENGNVENELFDNVRNHNNESNKRSYASADLYKENDDIRDNLSIHKKIEDIINAYDEDTSEYPNTKISVNNDEDSQYPPCLMQRICCPKTEDVPKVLFRWRPKEKKVIKNKINNEGLQSNTKRTKINKEVLQTHTKRLPSTTKMKRTKERSILSFCKPRDPVISKNDINVFSKDCGIQYDTTHLYLPKEETLRLNPTKSILTVWKSPSKTDTDKERSDKENRKNSSIKKSVNVMRRDVRLHYNKLNHINTYRTGDENEGKKRVYNDNAANKMESEISMNYDSSTNENNVDNSTNQLSKTYGYSPCCSYRTTPEDIKVNKKKSILSNRYSKISTRQDHIRYRNAHNDKQSIEYDNQESDSEVRSSNQEDNKRYRYRVDNKKPFRELRISSGQDDNIYAQPIEDDKQESNGEQNEIKKKKSICFILKPSEIKKKLNNIITTNKYFTKRQSGGQDNVSQYHESDNERPVKNHERQEVEKVKKIQKNLENKNGNTGNCNKKNIAKPKSIYETYHMCKKPKKLTAVNNPYFVSKKTANNNPYLVSKRRSDLSKNKPMNIDLLIDSLPEPTPIYWRTTIPNRNLITCDTYEQCNFLQKRNKLLMCKNSRKVYQIPTLYRNSSQSSDSLCSNISYNQFKPRNDINLKSKKSNRYQDTDSK